MTVELNWRWDPRWKSWDLRWGKLNLGYINYCMKHRQWEAWPKGEGSAMLGFAKLSKARKYLRRLMDGKVERFVARHGIRPLKFVEKLECPAYIR